MAPPKRHEQHVACFLNALQRRRLWVVANTIARATIAAVTAAAAAAAATAAAAAGAGAGAGAGADTACAATVTIVTAAVVIPCMSAVPAAVVDGSPSRRQQRRRHVLQEES